MSCTSRVNATKTQFFDDRVSECFLAIDSASRLNTATQLTFLNSPFNKRINRLSTRTARELFTDAFRGIQYHIQHFIRLGEHRNVTAL